MQRSPGIDVINQAKAEIKSLLEEAKAHAQLERDEGAGVTERREKALFNAWQTGVRLNKLKPLIGHGNWKVWLTDNFCKPLKLSYTTATVYMTIDAKNPNVQRVEDLQFDTIRKYAIRFVPEKKKKKLKGDVTFGRNKDHMKVINEWSRYKRRRDTGQIKYDIDDERRDFREMRDWMDEVLYAEE